MELTNDSSDNWKKKMMLRNKMQNKLGELLHLIIMGIAILLILPYTTLESINSLEDKVKKNNNRGQSAKIGIP